MSEFTSTRRVSLLGYTAAALAAIVPLTFALASVPTYTKGQAENGRGIFAAKCAQCHGPALEGGAGPTLVGPYFSAQWGDRTAGDLFLKVSTTMPLSAPGSLDRESYAALLAFILMSNSIPATDTPLPTDPSALGRMTIPASQ